MLDQRTFSQATYDWQREDVVSMPAYRECAYSLLRATLGIVFLTAGVGKFLGGIGNFAAGLEQQFAGKLPSMLVVAFGYALPFAEVAVGALLVFGLFNELALIMSGLLLMALTFGTAIKGDFPTVAHNVSYALVNFALLWLANYNGYSLDRLLRRRPINQ